MPTGSVPPPGWPSRPEDLATLATSAAGGTAARTGDCSGRPTCRQSAQQTQSPLTRSGNGLNRATQAVNLLAGPAQLGCDPQRRDQGAQVADDRLLQRQQHERVVLDAGAGAIDPVALVCLTGHRRSTNHRRTRAAAEQRARTDGCINPQNPLRPSGSPSDPRHLGLPHVDPYKLPPQGRLVPAVSS